MKQSQIDDILSFSKSNLLQLVPTAKNDRLHVSDYFTSNMCEYKFHGVIAPKPKYSNWYHVVSSLSSKLSDTKKRARNHNFECNIDLHYLAELWIDEKGLCNDSKLPMSFEAGSQSDKNPFSCSIDRIDNAMGYVKGNVRLVTHWANNSKSTWDKSVVETFILATAKRLLEETA